MGHSAGAFVGEKTRPRPDRVVPEAFHVRRRPPSVRLAERPHLVRYRRQRLLELRMPGAERVPLRLHRPHSRRPHCPAQVQQNARSRDRRAIVPSRPCTQRASPWEWSWERMHRSRAGRCSLDPPYRDLPPCDSMSSPLTGPAALIGSVGWPRTFQFQPQRTIPALADPSQLAAAWSMRQGCHNAPLPTGVPRTGRCRRACDPILPGGSHPVASDLP